MSEPILDFVTCPNVNPADPGEHRMAYWRWGEVQVPRTLLCVHGLSRVGRDFDVLARALVAAFKGELNVVAPDVAGRGKSDWLQDAAGYGIPQYASDMMALLQKLDAPSLDWLGTSMGGIIAMVTLGTQGCAVFKLKHLILNDVGPEITVKSVARIGAYLGKAPHFASVQAGADYLRSISPGFGPHTPEQWLRLSEPLLLHIADHYQLHYDPKIAEPFNAITPEQAQLGKELMWRLYDKIDCRTLLVRGAQSDLLEKQIAIEMTQRGPRAELIEFADVGHAPMFVQPEQIAVIEAFLRS